MSGFEFTPSASCRARCENLNACQDSLNRAGDGALYELAESVFPSRCYLIAHTYFLNDCLPSDS